MHGPWPEVPPQWPDPWTAKPGEFGKPPPKHPPPRGARGRGPVERPAEESLRRATHAASWGRWGNAQNPDTR
eukprot:3245570-Alexandrium_andersonii.AAC.1